MKKILVIVFVISTAIFASAQQNKTYEGALKYAGLTKVETVRVLEIQKEKKKKIGALKQQNLNSETKKRKIQEIRKASNVKVKRIIGDKKYSALTSYWAKGAKGKSNNTSKYNNKKSENSNKKKPGLRKVSKVKEQKTFMGSLKYAKLSKEEISKVKAINDRKIKKVNTIKSQGLSSEITKQKVQKEKQKARQKIEALVGKDKYSTMLKYWSL